MRFYLPLVPTYNPNESLEVFISLENFEVFCADLGIADKGEKNPEGYTGCMRFGHFFQLVGEAMKAKPISVTTLVTVYSIAQLYHGRCEEGDPLLWSTDL